MGIHGIPKYAPIEDDGSCGIQRVVNQISNNYVEPAESNELRQLQRGKTRNGKTHVMQL